MEVDEDAGALELSAVEKLYVGDDAPPIVMYWKMKAHPLPALIMDGSMAVLGLIPLMLYLYGTFLYENENSRHVVVNSASIGMFLVFIFWIGVARQKTFYTYHITDQGGTVDYWLHFPKYAGLIFKGIAIFVLVAVLAMISIMPMMIFALVGVGAVTIPAALKLLAWENEISSDSFEWDRVQLISTDRKRNLVILQRRYDPAIPFEQNYMYFSIFLPKHRLNEFLDCCRKYAPLNVDFKEGKIGY